MAGKGTPKLLSVIRQAQGLDPVEESILKKLTPHVPGIVTFADHTKPLPWHTDYKSVLVFADISGFTALCERYSSMESHGINQLTKTLNDYVGALVEVIAESEGDVLKFAGDAILALWRVNALRDLLPTVEKVISCCLTIQQKCGEWQTRLGITLTVKTGISCGNMTVTFLGNEQFRVYVERGQAVTDVNRAEQFCKSGYVVLSPNTWEICRKTLYQFELLEDKEHVRILARKDPQKQLKSKSGLSVEDFIQDDNSMTDVFLTSYKAGRPSKKYKAYETDDKVTIPRSTFFYKKKKMWEGNPMSDEQQQLPSCPHIHELPGVCLGSQEQAQIASNEISTENKGQVSGTEQNQMCVRPIQTQDEITTGLLSAHSTPANFPVQYDGTQCIKDIPLYFHDDNDLHEEYAGAPDPNEDEGRGTFEEPMEIVTSDDADEEDNNENECHNIDIARSNEDPPLYVIPPSNSLYKCQVSHSEYVLSASALASRYKMSAKMIRDVMKFSQLIMPENNLCDTSFEQLQRSCGFDASYLKYHLYCIRCKKLFDMDSEEENCKTPGCGNTKSDKNCYFVTGSLQIQLKEVLERKGMWPSIKESTSGGDVISDIKNGQGYRELQKSGGFLDNTNNITLSLFIDGIPLYSSSSVSLWPVYLLINEISPKERFKKKNMLLWGVWQGVGKPNMNMFLRPLVVDLIKLYTDGIPISVQTEVGKNEEFKEVIVKAMLVVATMDLQARAYVTNMTQHNGENGCLYCMEPGQMVPSGKAFCRAYLPREQSPKLRTDDEARESAITAQETNSRTSGFMGESVLWYLPYFSMTNSIVIDYMHGTLLGVTKKFLYYWFDTKFSNKEFYIGKNVKDVDKALREIRPPYIIHRLPRILSDTYHHWKASELRNWLLFYSIPCLQNILPDVYLTHFSCLVEGTYLLLTEGLTMDDVSRADLLLQTFVKNVQILYGDSAMSLNVHNLTHLVKFVKQWGPLWAWSCFPFESFNGEIKQSVHGTGNVCKQIFWSLQSQKRVESRSSQVSSSKVQEFLKSLLNPRSETFTSDCEAYQCSVVKSSSSSVLLPDEVKEDLKEKAGTDVESHYISISKIARNGFQMYSKSCLRVKKQNSYTIKLERPFKTNDILCDIVEVQSYVMVKSSRKVFAIGSVMKSSGSIIPHRIPHMQKIEPVGDKFYAIPAENLLEPMMVVKTRSSVFAALLPNNNERD